MRLKKISEKIQKKSKKNPEKPGKAQKSLRRHSGNCKAGEKIEQSPAIGESGKRFAGRWLSRLAPRPFSSLSGLFSSLFEPFPAAVLLWPGFPVSRKSVGEKTYPKVAPSVVASFGLWF